MMSYYVPFRGERDCRFGEWRLAAYLEWKLEAACVDHDFVVRDCGRMIGLFFLAGALASLSLCRVGAIAHRDARRIGYCWGLMRGFPGIGIEMGYLGKKDSGCRKEEVTRMMMAQPVSRIRRLKVVVVLYKRISRFKP